tara:strand:- start:5026 stop:5325 length:300 start_codon:yes stop_codon:yes gene_type:complete
MARRWMTIELMEPKPKYPHIMSARRTVYNHHIIKLPRQTCIYKTAILYTSLPTLRATFEDPKRTTLAEHVWTPQKSSREASHVVLFPSLSEIQSDVWNC